MTDASCQGGGHLLHIMFVHTTVRIYSMDMQTLEFESLRSNKRMHLETKFQQINSQEKMTPELLIQLLPQSHNKNKVFCRGRTRSAAEHGNRDGVPQL
jgi:transcriptional regulator of heat shock response